MFHRAYHIAYHIAHHMSHIHFYPTIKGNW